MTLLISAHTLFLCKMIPLCTRGGGATLMEVSDGRLGHAVYSAAWFSSFDLEG